MLGRATSMNEVEPRFGVMASTLASRANHATVTAKATTSLLGTHFVYPYLVDSINNVASDKVVR